MHRSLLAASATLLATLSLAACTSQTQSCKNGVCDIDISGKGSTVQLGGDGGSTLELIKASGKTAEVKIGENTGTLTVGEPVALDNGTIELVAVEGEDDVQIQVKGSKDDSGDEPASSK